MTGRLIITLKCGKKIVLANCDSAASKVMEEISSASLKGMTWYKATTQAGQILQVRVDDISAVLYV